MSWELFHNPPTSLSPVRVDAIEKGLRTSPNSDSADSMDHVLGGGDDGSAVRRSGTPFLSFHLDDRVPKDHLLRRIDCFVMTALADMHERLKPYYSEIGRPLVDPELMIRMLIVGYCYGLRSERRLTQEVELHLAYRWFCRLDLDDKVPHTTRPFRRTGCTGSGRAMFSPHIRACHMACMAAGLVKGEEFAVDASVTEANASRYHGKAPDEIAWAEPERRTRAVKEYLAALEAEAEVDPDRKPMSGTSRRFEAAEIKTAVPISCCKSSS